MTLPSKTSNFKIILPNFNSLFWHDEFYQAMRTVDTVLAQYVLLGNVQGAWANSTAYTVGQVLVDEDLGTMHRCISAHTSAASGTFEADRLARPLLWEAASVTNQYRGAWTTATAYRAGDFVVSGNKYGVATRTFTSGATYAADESAEYFDTLIDLSAIPASVVPVPNVSTALFFVRQNAAGDGYEVLAPSATRTALGLGSLALLSSISAGSIASGGAVANAPLLADGAGNAAFAAYAQTRVIKGTAAEITTLSINETSGTVAHGLGGAPDFIQLTLVCTDAAGDAGYAQNDVVFLGGLNNTSGTTNVANVFADGTNIQMRYTNNSLPSISNKSANTAAAITDTRWKLVATPFRIV